MVSLDIENCKVALLAGGKSGERDISFASGEGARKALLEAGFQVEMFDPAKRTDLHALIDGDFDVAFMCLHGRYGEDGRVQGFLETIGIPYTGSGVWSSALAMDKPKAKIQYGHSGLKTPKGFVFTYGDEINYDEVIAELGEDCVVKPCNEGSALGVYMAHGAIELEDVINIAFQNADEIMVEQRIFGLEATATVIGGKKIQALPVIQIVPKSKFYDFDAKYLPGGSEHICPAPFDEDLTKEIQDMALEAHRSLGCWGMSRSDFMIDEQGVPWILETNTIPGMTQTSLMPDAAAADGISFPDLCTKLIEYAFECKER